MQSNLIYNIGFVLLLIVLTVGGRFLMNYWISRKGWTPLSELFLAYGEVEGTKIKFVSMGIGKGIYKNSVDLIYNDQGLYLRMPPIFNMFHPPLFIPWNQFYYNEIKNPLSFNRHEIEISNPAITSMIFNDNTFKVFRDYVIR